MKAPATVYDITRYLFNPGLKAQKLIFALALFFCATPWVSAPFALLLGLLLAQTTKHPYLQYNHKATRILLQFSVVGLGFGMNINTALKAGSQGIFFTVVSILSTFIAGYVISKLLKIEKKTSFLISSGTAICGGSAIAAISPVIKAKEKQISVALGTIFILNSVALFIFPAVGHALQMSQTQFGLWCAIAIHDTSSVVGAAGKYGARALEVATTVKLVRALWIIPLAFLSTLLFKNTTGKISIPWFIGLFVLAMLANTYVPVVHLAGPYIVAVAKAGLTVTLFLIGAGLSAGVLRRVGFKPLLMGIVLWALISVSSLYGILHLA